MIAPPTHAVFELLFGTISTYGKYREYYMVTRKYEIYFECEHQYLTSERSERVRYHVQHEK